MWEIEKSSGPEKYARFVENSSGVSFIQKWENRRNLEELEDFEKVGGRERNKKTTEKILGKIGMNIDNRVFQMQCDWLTKINVYNVFKMFI